MYRHFPRLLGATFAVGSALSAQSADPFSAEVRRQYLSVKNYLLLAAEKMPEENYGFKPAPRVRTFGQILGHLAEEHYLYCGAVKGEEKAADVEKAKTSKADILAALKDSFAYCDGVYASMTDATALQPLKPGDARTKLHMLWGNTIHENQHYGNLVTYMRIKGLVPPSTEGQ